MFLKKERSLHRDVLREAMAFAWHERRLWILALFAGILQTGGIYDVFFRSVSILSSQAIYLAQTSWANPLENWHYTGPRLTTLPGFLSLTSWVEGLIFVLLLIFTILAFSVIAQGALTYGLSVRVRGHAPLLKSCLSVGARHFASLLGLNLFSLGLIFLIRFLVLIPYTYSLTNPSYVSVSLYLLTFFAFIAAIIILTAIHLLALNAIIIDRRSLADAIAHAYALFIHSWAAILEFGAMLFAMSFSVMVLVAIGFCIASFPLFLLMIVFFVPALSWMGFLFLLLMVLGLAILLTTGSALVCFQYAAWNRLYGRINDDTAISKVIRWIDRLLHRI